jgi:hypothetical protein
MPLFLEISKHNPESCPLVNEKVRKLNVDLMAKWDELSKKYNIKTVGMWASLSEHLMVAVYDAPNYEALVKVSMEPEVMNWGCYSTTEIRQVLTGEEAVKMMT